MSSSGFGRYAPSPSGDLHVGNLRTAVLAWLFACHSGRGFCMRIDDIDAQRSTEASAQRQLEDLAALGLTWEQPVARQQDTLSEYRRALADLQERSLVYECYCSRKDIQEAARAPHAIPGRYPGTCRDLSPKTRAARRAELEKQGRVPSLRLLSDANSWTIRESFSSEAEHGRYEGDVDDFVLRRGGNVGQASEDDFAYNLAVVVDDHLAGVDQIVRGDDLLSSAPRQAYLAQLLGYEQAEYVHVPLVLGPTGKRLAKRDGAVTLRELVPGDLEASAECARAWIAESLGLAGGEGAARSAAPTLEEMLERFDPVRLPKEPVQFLSN